MFRGRVGPSVVTVDPAQADPPRRSLRRATRISPGAPSSAQGAHPARSAGPPSAARAPPGPAPDRRGRPGRRRRRTRPRSRASATRRSTPRGSRRAARRPPRRPSTRVRSSPTPTQPPPSITRNQVQFGFAVRASIRAPPRRRRAPRSSPGRPLSMTWPSMPVRPGRPVRAPVADPEPADSIGIDRPFSSRATRRASRSAAPPAPRGAGRIVLSGRVNRSRVK